MGDVPVTLYIGIGAALGAVVVTVIMVVACRCLCNKNKKKKLLNGAQYEAIGSFNPHTQALISPSPTQESISSQQQRTAQAVQPRTKQVYNVPSLSREALFSGSDSGSMKSLPSVRSDTSGDTCSGGVEAHLGALQPDLYQKRDTVIRQTSKDSSGRLGKLHLRLRYDFKTSDLVVHLIEAQDLPSMDVFGGFSDPYMRLYLRPESDNKTRQTSVKKHTLNPVYDEYFKFPVAFEELPEKTLHIEAYDFDKFSRHDVIGEVQVHLEQVDVSSSVEVWSDIEKVTEGSFNLGEVLISLSYLPTAERLTVVVMKANSLKSMDLGGSSDPFARVSLLHDGKKIKRKKTSVRKNTVNPVWNEALVFQVRADMLPKVSLEVMVMDYDLIGHSELIGRCILGRDLPGSEGSHWNDMMQNFRKAVAMWHTLRKM